MKEKIKSLMEDGYLLDPDVLDSLDEVSINLIGKYVLPSEGIIISKNLVEDLREKYIEKEKPLVSESNTCVEIIKDYKDINRKIQVSDFVEHYKIRYNVLRKILQARPELNDTISINRSFGKMERERVSLIGLVMSKDVTKNNNILIELEDPTGSIKVLITSNKGETYTKAQDIVLDEVIGIRGNMGNKIVFANDLFFPDTPQNIPIKKSSNDESVVFISDLHIGSKMFLEDEFKKFIKWLNMEVGSSEQKKLAESVKYLVIAGDVVDGISVYPEQEEELHVVDMVDQYKKCAELLAMIRNDIKIIISPGNHDTIRLAEPQPVYDKTFAAPLYALKNLTIISNPGMVTIGKNGKFDGFDILVYHGHSFSYYVNQVERLRNAGGFDNAEQILKFILQKRHLAPSHTSTLFVVDPVRDDLIIECVPDFFVCGHAHKFSLGQYGKTTVLSGSCWQTRTIYQDKGGHHPEPGKVPVINLKTREVKVMKFYEENE